MIVIERQHHSGTELVLNARMIVEGMRNLEARVDGDRNLSSGAKDPADGGEVAEGIPRPIVRRYGKGGIRTGKICDGGVRCCQELIRSVAAQLLNVAHVYRCICGNRRMAGHHDIIQIVDPIESCAQTVGARSTGRLNLRLRHSVRNTDGGASQLLKQTSESCGVSVEKPGE